MEVCRTYPEKKGHKYHKTGTRMEPHGHRKQGRPKNTWRRGLHTELKKIGKTWNEAKKKTSKRQKEVERNSSRPMSPFGRIGLSK